VPSFEDGDITIESIKTAYTAYLANGIGNLTSRIMKMATTNKVALLQENIKSLASELELFNTNLAIKNIFLAVGDLDKKIQETEPFKLVKVDEGRGKQEIAVLLQRLYAVAFTLESFLPRTSAKIIECIRENKMPEKPLFNRLS
jgi:methionyl-tRNA synthetase